MVNSLPLRLNNPFALRKSAARWLGKIESHCAFEQFETLELGVRAGLINLCTQLRKYNSLLGLIAAYAPPSENNTKAYYDYVSSRVTKDYNSFLTDEMHFILLAFAISHYECGCALPCTISPILHKYHIFEKHLILLSRTRK